MEDIWGRLVGLVQLLLTLLAAASGGSAGTAIVAVSLALRLALLPLTLRVARNAEAQRRLMESLRPRIEALKQRFANDPRQLSQRTLALYREHGVRPVDGGAIASVLLQLPLMSALYTAIRSGFGAGQRFLWIADLGRPDLVLIAITGALTYVASHFGSPQTTRPAIAWLGVVVTAVVMWRVSAALALYWASSTAVGAAQAAWLRYRRA